jgi:Rod binding domain-containing protein
MPLPLAPFAVSAAAGLVSGLAGTAREAGPKTVAPAALGPRAAAEAKARKTAQDFEAMFLEQSLDRMFASAGESGPLGENGTGGSVYRSMLVKEYAGTIVKSGGVGIGDQVFRELMHLQEASSHG